MKEISDDTLERVYLTTAPLFSKNGLFPKPFHDDEELQVLM